MTGAEALQKIIENIDQLNNTVNELKTSIQLIEANIKTLNNRAAGLMKESVPSGMLGMNKLPNASVISAGAPIQKPTQQTIQSSPAPSRGRQLVEMPEEQREETNNVIKNDDNSGIMTYKKVFGKLVNNSEEPIENVLIKIYDKNNEVCATTETDPIGYWETMLKPGRYVAEYIKSGFKTTNKTFSISKNAKEIEVK